MYVRKMIELYAQYCQRVCHIYAILGQYCQSIITRRQVPIGEY